MPNKKILNEEELNKTSGGIDSFNYIRGDYGDADKDTDPNNSMYKVGMWVELYLGDIHLWTEQHQIIDAKYERGHWKYCF